MARFHPFALGYPDACEYTHVWGLGLRVYDMYMYKYIHIYELYSRGDYVGGYYIVRHIKRDTWS